MDAGKETEDPGDGGQSVDQEISDANGIWQANVIKIGITLIVILISALWFCWNRVQERSTKSISVNFEQKHDKMSVPKKRMLFLKMFVCGLLLFY